MGEKKTDRCYWCRGELNFSNPHSGVTILASWLGMKPKGYIHLHNRCEEELYLYLEEAPIHADLRPVYEFEAVK